MRKMPMPERKDAIDGSDDKHCCLCGKKVNPARMWAVHIVDGGASVVHPDDSHMIPENDAGDMYCHMIGTECRKCFGEFAFKWEA